MTEQGQRILLVEDEAIVALVESRQLHQAGYNVLHVSTGEDAICSCDDPEEHIDLVLMDIDLGDGIDGIEAARRILARHNIPLIFLSAHTEPEVVQRTEAVTNYGYIVKSTGSVVLLSSIRMAFKLFLAHMELENHKKKLEAATADLRTRESELRTLGLCLECHT